MAKRFRAFALHLYGRDPGRWRAVRKPGSQQIDLRFRSVRQNLDSSVRQIPRPTGQPAPSGFLSRAGAEKNTLNPPRYKKPLAVDFAQFKKKTQRD